jgi:hypothetical protein
VWEMLSHLCGFAKFNLHALWNCLLDISHFTTALGFPWELMAIWNLTLSFSVTEEFISRLERTH